MSKNKFIVKDDWSGYFDQYSVQSPSSEVKEEVRKEQKKKADSVASDGPNYFDAAPEVTVHHRKLVVVTPFIEHEDAQDYIDGQERIAKQMEDFINAECASWVGGDTDDVCVSVDVAPEPEVVVSAPVEEIEADLEVNVEEPVTEAPVVEEKVKVAEEVAEIAEHIEAEAEAEVEAEEVKSTLKDLQGFIFILTVQTDTVEDVDITFTDGRKFEDVNDVEVLPATGIEKIDKAIAILEKYDNTDVIYNVNIKFKEGAMVEPVAEVPAKPRKSVTAKAATAKKASSTAKKSAKAPAKKK